MIESDQPNIFCSIPSVAQGDGKTAEQKWVPLKFDGQEREAGWLEGDLSHVLKIAGHDVVISASSLRKLADLAPSVSPGTAANKTEADSGIKKADKALAVEIQKSRPCDSLPEVRWQMLRTHVLSEIADIDDKTMWLDKEPRWWLQMMAVQHCLQPQGS